MKKVWNPTDFDIGTDRRRRGAMPKYRGNQAFVSYYPFIPGKIWDVGDHVAKYLIAEWGCFGLVEYPDRNIFPKEEDHKKACESQTTIAKVNMRNQAQGIVDSYEKLQRKFVTENRPTTNPSDLIVTAYEVIEKYKDSEQSLDPAIHRKREIRDKVADKFSNKKEEKKREHDQAIIDREKKAREEFEKEETLKAQEEAFLKREADLKKKELLLKKQASDLKKAAEIIKKANAKTPKETVK